MVEINEPCTITFLANLEMKSWASHIACDCLLLGKIVEVKCLTIILWYCCYCPLLGRSITFKQVVLHTAALSLSLLRCLCLKVSQTQH